MGMTRGLLARRLLFVAAVAQLSPALATCRGQSGRGGDRRLRWNTSEPSPEPRADYAAGAVDGKLIVAGGTYWDGAPGHWIRKRYSASTRAFDPVSKRWERLPDMPLPLAFAASAVSDNTLPIFGGYTGTHVSRDIFALISKHGRYEWTRKGETEVDRLLAFALVVDKNCTLSAAVKVREKARTVFLRLRSRLPWRQHRLSSGINERDEGGG